MNKTQTYYVRMESCSHFINKQIVCSDHSNEFVDFTCGSLTRCTLIHSCIIGVRYFIVTLEFLQLQKFKSTKMVQSDLSQMFVKSFGIF